jgi:hypothetical protein
VAYATLSASSASPADVVHVVLDHEKVGRDRLSRQQGVPDPTLSVEAVVDTSLMRVPEIGPVQPAAPP